MTKDANVDGKYYEVISSGGIAERLLVVARDRLYADFLEYTHVERGEKILDVGVSDVISTGANVLERNYPYPSDITACGISTAPDFVAAFPNIRYVQIIPNQRLPFEDGEFEVATANAVLEHVGSHQNQLDFVAELARVSRKAFLTVPNRLFPIEHHTSIPFLHYWDRTFRVSCQLLGKTSWTDQTNLILMTAARLRSLVPSGYRSTVGFTGLNIGAFSSNLFMYLERN